MAEWGRFSDENETGTILTNRPGQLLQQRGGVVIYVDFLGFWAASSIALSSM